MIYLTAQQVLFIHSRLVDETGGKHGVRELSLLESAVARPQATFDQQELYPHLHAKAAALLDSLINNHPFTDGNKRTGATATGLFLLANGVRLTASNLELEPFILKVASSHLDLASVAAWLEAHSKSVEQK